MAVSLKMVVHSFCMVFLVMTFLIELGRGQNHCEEVQSCGRQPIRFPFRLKDRQSVSCGYPGFDLSCTQKGQTVIELPIPATFFVRKIDYKSQQIELYDPENCLLRKLLKDHNISASPFDFADSSNDYTLFNCSAIERNVGNGWIPCLSGPNYQVYALQSYFSIEQWPLVGCTKLFNRTGIPYDTYNKHHDNTLLLSWSEPHCGQCEADGTKCRFKNNVTRSETQCFRPKTKEGSTKPRPARRMNLELEAIEEVE
ncbi:hypothetical protein FEM48_Zijuj03G0174100 [Ziziphus jujuba var. spinosa]|uniref:RING-type E3 ubiquitin transferase n=1 Tax=Ziziphus jujuba var. spinosa TaxID=714518 RepID=A0A978VRM9_ZIZJJ|nr:hypothetical protein FEM48_Zijuj03G0174100 [Ziziphus jujuba var. spinosa]